MRPQSRVLRSRGRGRDLPPLVTGNERKRGHQRGHGRARRPLDTPHTQPSAAAESKQGLMAYYHTGSPEVKAPRSRRVLVPRSPNLQQPQPPQQPTSAEASQVQMALAGLGLGLDSTLTAQDENSPVHSHVAAKQRQGRGGDADPDDVDVEVECYSNLGDYLRQSVDSTSGLSSMSLAPNDPLPRTYSARDWRRHERGLYRESTALNEDEFMYALVIKRKINHKSPLWSVEALQYLEEEGLGCESDDSEVEAPPLDISCCLPACGNGCLGVSCVCDINRTVAAAGRCLSLGLCEWDGGRRRKQEDEARLRRMRVMLISLRRAGLEAKKVHSLDRKRVLIKVSATEARLEEEAEKVKLRIQRADGTWAKFKRSKRHLFVGCHDSLSLFRSSDKQMLINRIMRSSALEGGAGLGEHSPLADSIEVALPLHMYARLSELRNDWLTFWRSPMTPDVPHCSARQRSRLSELGVEKLSPLPEVDEEVESPSSDGVGSRDSLPEVEEVDDGDHLVGASSARNSTVPEAGPVEVEMGRLGGSHRRSSAAAGGGASSDRKASLVEGQGGRESVSSGNSHATNVTHISWASAKSTSSTLALKGASCWYSVRRIFGSILYQPLDRIASYFGERIAFYFAWLEFYTRWLIIPALLGIVLFVFQVRSGTIDHPLVPVYSLFIALWSTLFLEFWRRRNVELAQKWGVLGYEKEEVKRPQFTGEFRENELTGELEKVYPTWKRVLKSIVSVSFVMCGLGAVSVLMVYIFSTRDQLVESLSPTVGGNGTESSTSASLDIADVLKYADREEFWLALSLPSALYGLMIPLLDWVFQWAAAKFNRWENHATESSFRNNLVWKVFPFRFFNSFVSLYYYAFSSRHSILVLSVQLASFVAGSQMWNNVVAVLIPCLCRKNRMRKDEKRIRKATRDAAEAPSRELLRQAQSSAWYEARLQRYNTFQDYTEMIIQFGYVTFFSMAFPLAPLVAFLSNCIEVRADAYKLCYNTQRPSAAKSGGIGVWFRILQVMSVAAVITNCVHIAITSKQLEFYLPFVANQNKIVLIFVFEHIVLGLRLFIAYMVPHVPESVQRKMRADNARLSAASLKSEFSFGGLRFT